MVAQSGQTCEVACRWRHGRWSLRVGRNGCILHRKGLVLIVRDFRIEMCFGLMGTSVLQFSLTRQGFASLCPKLLAIKPFQDDVLQLLQSTYAVPHILAVQQNLRSVSSSPKHCNQTVSLLSAHKASWLPSIKGEARTMRSRIKLCYQKVLTDTWQMVQKLPGCL